MKKCIKMYENKYKNIKITRKSDLDTVLQLLADLDEEIELFAIGGTAMVLKNIKESTKDIDFLTSCDYEKLRKLLKAAGLREESPSKLCNIWYLDDIRIDLFYDAFIIGVTLPNDWKKLSEHIKDVGKIRLYILNWYDIIITKIARGEERDYQDIQAIIKEQKVDFKKLKERYYSLAEVSIIAEYEYKFNLLEHLLGIK